LLDRGKFPNYDESMGKFWGMVGFWSTALIGVYLLFKVFSPLTAGIILLIMATFLAIIFGINKEHGRT